MIATFYNKFSHLGLMLQGACHLWEPAWAWVYAGANVIIALAYVAALVALLYFAAKARSGPQGVSEPGFSSYREHTQHRNLPLWFYQLLGAYLVVAGLAHGLEMWAIWHPIYWLTGLLKSLTAGMALTTVGVAIPLIPKVLLSSAEPPAFDTAGLELERQVSDRTQALQQNETRLQRALEASESRNAAEVALAESRQQYQNLVENSPDIIERFDLQLRHLYVSPALHRITGIAPQDFLGKTCRELGMDEDMIASWEAAAEILLRTGQRQVIEFSTPTLQGIRSFEMAIAPEWSEQQTLQSILCISRDITDRKQVETQLQDLSDRLSLAMQSAKMGVWDWDIIHNRLTWDDRVYELYGLQRNGEVTYADWEAIIHPDDIAYCQATVQHDLAERGEGMLEFRVKRPDGSLGYVASYYLVQRNAEGQPVRCIGVNLDISDRKQAEAERLQTENLRIELTLLETIIDGVLAGYWDTDYVTQTTYWSPGLKRMFGYQDHELPNEFNIWEKLIFEEDLPAVQACFERHVQSRGKEPYYNEVRYHHKDGSTVWVICAGQVIRWGPAGQPLRIVGCHVDITKLKQIELKLLEKTTQLDASNRELEAFAYSVSHDLRAPLRAIDGFSKALLEDYGEQFDEEGKDYFARIRHNVQRMSMLIDDLLSLSRISRYEMQPKKVNLSKLVEEQVLELQATEPERQAEFVIAPDVVVSADSTLMSVAIANLMANAWKFTSHHSSARIEFGIIKQNNKLVYFIRDDGAGFDMAYATKLFGVFQRLHNTNEFPGTGIGLATVQRAIHRHGGQIWAEATVEQGATFYFTLPGYPTGFNA